MKYKFILTSIAVTLQLQATTITSLLNTLEQRPEHRLDMIDVKKSNLDSQSISDKLMPTVNIFGGYEVYSSPNGLVPVPPNKLIGMVKDQSIGQPFSKNIFREGVNFTWPLFVKSVYTLEDKAELLHLAAKEKKKLNLLQREALVVGSVAQLRYLESLKAALIAKKHSILETENITKLKIKEGRTPQSALFILQSNINTLEININNIEQNINLIYSKVDTLTGVSLKQSLPIRLKHKIKKGEIFALKPLKRKLEATQKEVQATNEAYYPSVLTKGNYTYSQGDAYNNGNTLHESFGMVGLYISMPLFDASKGTASEQAKVAYLKKKSQLSQTAHALKVQAKQLTREIKLLKRSVALAKKSVFDQKRLLKIAKVSLKDEIITQEEYLRYEDTVADAKAALYKAEAKKWQDIAQLAVIYGNDLRRIVK
jgi:outer membrane protein TolC